MKHPLLTLAALLAPTAALAHAGHHDGSFLTGAAHPLGGADHVLAMVALGLLAAQLGGRAIWALPLAFVGAMLAGGVAGFAGLAFPVVEPMILASVLVLGALVALAARVPLGAALAMTAVFGAAHGWAHGAEGPETGMAAYAIGFALVTAGLHIAGIGLGLMASGRALRALGGAAALAGVALTAV